MTKEELFDLVAPIHIYFHADLMYEREAKKAFRELKKKRELDFVKEYFDSFTEEDLEERGLNTVHANNFWSIYCRLFEEIVQESFPTFKPYFDSYGAKCFRDDATNEQHLIGDGYNHYPYYLQSEALKERLYDLGKEIA